MLRRARVGRKHAVGPRARRSAIDRRVLRTYVPAMASACTHDHAAPPEDAVVEVALAKVEARAIGDGFRWTEPRRRVYELLLRAGGPVKAYDLMELYRDAKPAKPPTVYRALDFLEQMGFVHRIASLNAYLACHEGDPAHAAAFLICDCCGSVQEFEPGAVRTATHAAALVAFRIRSVGLEVRGACAACA